MGARRATATLLRCLTCGMYLIAHVDILRWPCTATVVAYWTTSDDKLTTGHPPRSDWPICGNALRGVESCCLAFLSSCSPPAVFSAPSASAPHQGLQNGSVHVSRLAG
jgi:hypothetical protein